MKTPQIEAMAGMTPLGVKPGSSEVLSMTLEHAPNPDIHDSDGYWQPTVNAPREIVTIEVTNLRDAQTSFEAWRDANGIGGGNMTKRSGVIRRKNGQLVGRFSYNGQFWNPQGKEVVIGGGVA